jgi:hypothetical protein
MLLWRHAPRQQGDPQQAWDAPGSFRFSGFNQEASHGHVLLRGTTSQVASPRPTRAEATDVANAVLDGADGFLLGAETLRGGYPVVTVKTVASICRQAEAVFDSSTRP